MEDGTQGVLSSDKFHVARFMLGGFPAAKTERTISQSVVRTRFSVTLG